ncbi:MAG: hypothetical protein F7C38_05965 [Desulfurococcales archaeon]|nr:hypothetical protein [Desulfurococcales archaeon]
MQLDAGELPTLALYLVVMWIPPLLLLYRLTSKSNMSALWKTVFAAASIMLLLVLFLSGLLSIASYISLALLIGSYLSGRIGFSGAVFLGFVVSGVIGGTLQALYWPSESAVYFDVLGGVVGEEIYDLAVESLGDPHSASADATVPAAFRYPWVLMLGSLTAWCGLGAMLALVFHRLRLGHII